MNEKNTLLTSIFEDLFDTAAEKLAQMMGDFREEQGKKRNLVYGLAGLSQLLGCSISTAARIKKSGVLDPAIHQIGKIIVVDADLALDLMKIRRGRRR